MRLEDTDSLKNNLKGQNCPSSNKDYEVAYWKRQITSLHIVGNST
jgi:hypothetical protein